MEDKPIETVHHSDTTVSGGKDVVHRENLLRKAIEELELRFSVKGYKSSEGGVEFAPPDNEGEDDETARG